MTEDEMRSAMQSYIDGFNSGDAAALSALFGDDARIEDPVGSPTVVHGRAAIDEFYRRAVEVVDRLELVAIRASHGSGAAMAFDIHLNLDGQRMKIGVIDVMEFDASGKITEMSAYHGPGDVQMDPETA